MRYPMPKMKMAYDRRCLHVGYYELSANNEVGGNGEGWSDVDYDHDEMRRTRSLTCVRKRATEEIIP